MYQVLASVCASHADEPRVIEATYRSFRVVVQKHGTHTTHTLSSLTLSLSHVTPLLLPCHTHTPHLS